MKGDVMVMLILIKCVYDVEDCFWMGVMVRGMYKFGFYMLEGGNGCDMGIRMGLEVGVR